MADRPPPPPSFGYLESDVERIVGPVKWGAGGEGMIRCPFHDDKNPSLSLNIEKETFVCHACAEKGKLEKLLEAFGHQAPQQAEEQIYDYRSAAGELVYQVVRYQKNGEKLFYCRRPNGSGGWIKKGALSGITPLLFNAGAVRTAIAAGDPVIVCEGEKDAARLAGLGFAATTNHGGSGKWKAAHTEAFQSVDVVLCGDADKQASSMSRRCRERSRGSPGGSAWWISAMRSEIRTASTSPTGSTRDTRKPSSRS